jgi:hypothetical protein
MNEFYQALPSAAIGFMTGVNKYYVRPYMQEHAGALSWACLAGSVAVYDVFCPERQTLSETFRRQPKWAQYGEMALMCAHLMNLAPNIDPLSKALKAVKK